MLTITDLNVRADEHDRRAHDADRHGWMRADARGEQASSHRVGLGALVTLVRRRPAKQTAGGILTGGSMPAQRISPRGAA